MELSEQSLELEVDKRLYLAGLDLNDDDNEDDESYGIENGRHLYKRASAGLWELVGDKMQGISQCYEGKHLPIVSYHIKNQLRMEACKDLREHDAQVSPVALME